MNDDQVQDAKTVVLDVKRQKRRAIRELKRGVGQLADKAREAALAAAARRGAGPEEIVPVVIVYRERAPRRRRKRRGLLAEILGRL